MHFCIIGGGLTGLSAAFFLKKRFPTGLRLTVLESTDRCGGWLRSIRHSDGAVYELGPRSVRFRSPTAPYLLRLVEDLGLSSAVIPVHAKSSAATKRFIYCKGQLNQLKLTSLTTQAPFSKPFYQTLLSSAFSLHKYQSDMTVDNFFRTRFGNDIADYLADPIFRGIYASSTKNLGMAAVFPDLLRYEKIGNNIILGYLFDSFNEVFTQSSDIPVRSDLYIQAKSSNWLLWSLQGGIQTLIDALVEDLKKSGVEIITNCPVVNINTGKKKKKDNNISVNCNANENFMADHCLIATPAHVASKIIAVNPIALTTRFLKQFQSVNIAVVILEFKGNLRPVDGFGHLIPSSEIPHVLGIIYDSCIFPELDCKLEPTTRFTCMIGGEWFDQYCYKMENDDFEQLAMDSIRKQLGINDFPIRSFVSVHYNCIVQYGIDHHNVVNLCRENISQNDIPISLIGASYDGISVTDCVASAFNAVEKLSLH